VADDTRFQADRIAGMAVQLLREAGPRVAARGAALLGLGGGSPDSG